MPGQREIDKQLARARRMDYRKVWQTIPGFVPKERTPLEEAEHIIQRVQDREDTRAYFKWLKNLTPEERQRHERRELKNELENIRNMPIMTYRINWLGMLRDEYIEKLRQRDPELITPILKGIEKRPERQAKAERAIARRGIDPGVDEEDEYEPLWHRF